MKKVVIIFLVSCFVALGLKSQTKAQKFFQSKRYKASLVERDELCNENKELKNSIKGLKADTTRLGIAYRKADSLASVFNAKNKSLVSSTGTKLAFLSESLENKSKELDAKEKSIQEKDKKLRELQAILNSQDSILNALNNTIKNALLGFNSDEFSTEMKNGKVYVSLSDKLLFKSGSVTVEDKGKEAIKKLAEILNKNPDIDIAVEGHTDNVPIKTSLYKDNWDLSVARATNIVRMLSEDYLVSSKRLTSSGKGEFVPVGNNETPEGRAKNRRTEIVLSPKLEELFKMLNKGVK